MIITIMILHALLLQAPRYGLKGMIDASVALRLRRLPDGIPGFQAPAPTEDFTAPLEFKTGKPHQSHRAQVCSLLAHHLTPCTCVQQSGPNLCFKFLDPGQGVLHQAAISAFVSDLGVPHKRADRFFAVMNIVILAS
jgi:hypothetical protein